MKLKLLCLSALIACTDVQAYKFPDQQLSSYKCGETCTSLSHEPMHLEWAISDHALQHSLQHIQKSYGYKKKITLAELENGVDITTLAPQAVIRISPLSDQAIPQLKLKTAHQGFINLQEASALYSKENTFAEPGNDSKNQTIVQLKPEIGFGTFQLFSEKQLLNKHAGFILSVYDKYSNPYLTVETDKQEYQPHKTITATVILNDNLDYPIESVNAYVVSPNGDSQPLQLKKIHSNQYQGKTSLHSIDNDHGANWYVEASLSAWFDNHIFTRQGHAAFSYSIPSAKLVNIERVANEPYTFNATLQVSNSSRYALQAVLFYKDNQKIFHPITTSQTANWYEPGVHDMQFKLDKGLNNSYDDSSLYIGYLHVLDYGQLKTVYHYDEPIKLSELG